MKQALANELLSPAQEPYIGTVESLVENLVLDPSQQAHLIEADFEEWITDPSRKGFNPIDYLFNTGRRTPKFGLMYSANSGHVPISQPERTELAEDAKNGLDIVFYQCMSTFPSGVETPANVGLGAYETVSYWGGAMQFARERGYDIRAVIVDEASSLEPSSPLGVTPTTAQTTVDKLRDYLGKSNASANVLVRPMAEMFAAQGERALTGVDIAAIRSSKTESLESVIASDQLTVQAARVKLLLSQLTPSGAQEIGLEPYLDDSGIIPEDLRLSILPATVTRYIIDQVVQFDTRMVLRAYLIEDARVHGTYLPELGVSGRNIMRAGTTKSMERPTVRLSANGRDAHKRVVQVPYAIPTYLDGQLDGFARNIDMRSGRYGDTYNGRDTIQDMDGRPIALVEQ